MLLQLCPENSEEFIEYLISVDNLDEAAVKMAEIVNNVRVVRVTEGRDRNVAVLFNGEKN